MHKLWKVRLMEKYTAPEIEIIDFAAEDVITDSEGFGTEFPL